MATKLTVKTASIEARIADLMHELQVEKDKLIQARPLEPCGGTVIRFKKYDQKYAFAAIRLPFNAFESKWYITQDGSRTSRQGYPPKSWNDLLDWIGVRNWDSIEVLS